MSEERIQRNLERLLEATQGELDVLNDKLRGLKGTAPERCMADAGDDVERFVHCMNKSSKRVRKAGEMFGFRVSFFHNQAYQCFKDADAGVRTIEECNEIGQASFKRLLDQFFNEMTK
eukprot:TRINITY_DN2527_c0_g1_i1.p1 TRINITY_DN2527_c0_g1~~TRINITY_DN2527_c0_g1_i1.p1  ORF type:complete len:118 (-),score=29.83 TRINITY_DN2527_c0_g1_i1:111-464(-)